MSVPTKWVSDDGGGSFGTPKTQWSPLKTQGETWRLGGLPSGALEEGLARIGEKMELPSPWWG